MRETHAKRVQFSNACDSRTPNECDSRMAVGFFTMRESHAQSRIAVVFLTRAKCKSVTQIIYLGMSCPSWQKHRIEYRRSPVQTLPVAPLWCALGFYSRTVVVIKLRRTSVFRATCRAGLGEQILFIFSRPQVRPPCSALRQTGTRVEKGSLMPKVAIPSTKNDDENSNPVLLVIFITACNLIFIS